MTRHENRKHRSGGEIASKLRAVRSLTEVGQLLGMSPQRVEQVQNKALWKVSLHFKREAAEWQAH